MILLAFLDLVFVLALAQVYALVTRRQSRVYALVEHLAALAAKNLPLHAGLRMIARDAGGFFGARLERAARLLEEGRPLSAALDACPHTVPPLVRNMARAGERSGNLAGFLDELARSYRQVVEFQHRAIYYFLYPIMLSAGVCAMIHVLYYTVARRFEMIPELLCRPRLLDWSLVLAGSQLVLAAAVGLAALVYLGGPASYFGRSLLRFAKRPIDRLALWVPGVRGLVIRSSLRQYALSAGLMLRRGATLVEAARAAADLETNSVMRRRFEAVARGIEEGSPMSALVGALPGDFRWFVEAGERSGALGESLLQAAAFSEARVTYAGQLLIRLVIPGFVILNGAVLLAAAYGVFRPMTEYLRVVGVGV